MKVDVQFCYLISLATCNSNFWKIDVSRVMYYFANTLLSPMYTDLVVFALDHLHEQSRSVLHEFGEDLQQVPALVEVYQNLQFLKLKQTRYLDSLYVSGLIV